MVPPVFAVEVTAWGRAAVAAGNVDVCVVVTNDAAGLRTETTLERLPDLENVYASQYGVSVPR